jgi:hypothetical protein
MKSGEVLYKLLSNKSEFLVKIGPVTGILFQYWCTWIYVHTRRLLSDLGEIWYESSPRDVIKYFSVAVQIDGGKAVYILRACV